MIGNDTKADVPPTRTGLVLPAGAYRTKDCGPPLLPLVELITDAAVVVTVIAAGVTIAIVLVYRANSGTDTISVRFTCFVFCA